MSIEIEGLRDVRKGRRVIGHWLSDWHDTEPPPEEIAEGGGLWQRVARDDWKRATPCTYPSTQSGLGQRA